MSVLFVKSKVRDFIHARGCNTASDVVDGEELNDAIKDILEKACKRAKENGRKTVKPRDL